MMKNLKIPPELKGLKLADRLPSSQNLDVDIIIGNDYYGQLRTHRIAFTADIEKAFLQIELNNQDRDHTRLLWLKT